MRSLLKIFLYIVCSVFIGALLAPLFYKMIVLLPTDDFGFIKQLLNSVQHMPFHRYVSRTIQIVALILLWPTIDSLRIKHLSDLCLYPNSHAGRDFSKGVITALFPIWLVEAFFVGLGWYFWSGFCSWQIGLKILSTALTVAFLEEFLFRGVLLGLCRRFLTNGTAVVAVAFFFAGVHFLNLSHFKETTIRPLADLAVGEVGQGVNGMQQRSVYENTRGMSADVMPQSASAVELSKSSIHWWSGVSLLLNHDAVCSNWPLALGAFGTLFLLGLVLGWATVRTASLWLAIGLHAGWIFAQQFFHAVTHENFSHLLPWWGPFQIYGMIPIGILVLIPLGITVFLIKKMVPPRTNLFFK